MSYLNPLRLHFSGRFQADVSTVNNNPDHYDNATFKPEYQEPGTGGENGSWNPQGTGAWRLVDCSVIAVHYGDGSSATTKEEDPVVGLSIAGSDDQVAAKLVDLDPEQQTCSEIWGMSVRLTDGTTNYVHSQFKAAPFIDLWARAPRSAGDQNLAASYQSVLRDLVWNHELLHSKFLDELETVSSRKLSIKFNVDGYKLDSSDPTFTTGRIVGTIGPASADEPEHFVLGRHLMPVLANSNPTTPANGIYFTPCVVDNERGKVLVDLGNSLQTTTAGGPLQDIGELHLGIFDGQSFTPLGQVNYLEEGWYTEQAGIQAFPNDGELTSQEQQLLQDNPLVIVVVQNQQSTIAIQESIGGWYVRADEFVFRMDPNTTQDVAFYATRYGQRMPNEDVILSYNNSMIGGGPTVGTPVSALTFPAHVTTDGQGKAVARLASAAPGNPRSFIDGQIYGVGYSLASITNYNPNPWNFLSVLVWDDFVPDDPVTWWGSLQPIMQQYANLYPRMGEIVNLGRYDDVVRHRGILQLAFGLNPEDPNYMPATRDLSTKKRTALLQWLAQPVPPEGTPPSPAADAVAAALEPQPEEIASTKLRSRLRDQHVGKTIAMETLSR